MFPRSYFPGRYFPGTYFPPVVVPVLSGGTWTEPARGNSWTENGRKASWSEEPRPTTWRAPTMTTLVKRASEVRLYTMDLSNLPEIAGGDTVTAVSSVMASPATPGAAALTLTSPAVTSNSKGAQVQVAAGSDGATYQVVFTVTTAGGWTLVGIGYLYVDDQ